MTENRTCSTIKNLSRIQIEQKVREILDYLFPHRRNDFAIKHLKDIVDILKNEYNVIFDFTKELGSLPHNKKILGCFSVQPFKINTQVLQFKFERKNEQLNLEKQPLTCYISISYNKLKI